MSARMRNPNETISFANHSNNTRPWHLGPAISLPSTFAKDILRPPTDGVCDWVSSQSRLLAFPNRLRPVGFCALRLSLANIKQWERSPRAWLWFILAEIQKHDAIYELTVVVQEDQTMGYRQVVSQDLKINGRISSRAPQPSPWLSLNSKLSQNILV